jgi:hypothetical protein
MTHPSNLRRSHTEWTRDLTKLEVGNSMYVPVDSHTVSVYVSATARKLNTKYTTRSAMLAGVRGTRIWRIV